VKSTITILPSREIDEKKWNHCVEESTNGLIYSSTAYLNTMAENWHGLIVDDYASVMALPWKRKFGVRYAYTPPFIQQLGLIGDMVSVNWKDVLVAVQRFISFADIHFNFSNKAIQSITEVFTKTNLVLDLSVGYLAIESGYQTDLKENIKKANTGNVVYGNEDCKIGIECYKSYYRERMPHIKENDYDIFLRLCQSLQKSDQCFARSVRNEAGDVLAIGVFLRDQKRIYNLMNTTSKKGRDKEANHLLLNSVIKEFSGRRLLFDFEGSELPGVRSFYEKFGAENQPYFHYHFNGLPWPIRLLKR
jgi:hypothetical protein